MTAADGNRFAARLARPAEPSGAGVVICPDVRGLHNFYKDLCCRFAEAGIDAIAFDYFGRSAGLGERTNDFEYRSHVDATTHETVAMDVRAAVEHLRSEGAQRIFTIGFCFGGGNSWRQSAEQTGLAGVIGFYGNPGLAADAVDRMTAPVLMLLAGEDFRPMADFETFDRRLAEFGLPHRMVVYEGAPHSFFDRGQEFWADACADAWGQMLTFIDNPTGA